MAAVPISYNQEIARKLIHLSSLWMAVAMYLFPRTPMVLFFGVLLSAALFVEWARRHWPAFRRPFTWAFGRMMRPKELNNRLRLTGATYVILAAFVTIVLFPKLIACVTFAIMLVGDAIAALIGRSCGTHPLLDKTVEGTLAFAASAALVVLAVHALNPEAPALIPVGLAGVLVATLTELYSSYFRLDDNLFICLSCGGTMALVSQF